VKTGLVEPDQIVQQLVIDSIEVFKESIFAKLDEFLLDRAIKALAIGLHLGRLGIGLAAHYLMV
jgi:hypothetical protein